jgi:hypothetical protein
MRVIAHGLGQRASIHIFGSVDLNER